MGDLLGEDDALASKNILYRCLDLLLDRKAALFSHLKSRWQDLSASSCNVTEGHEENEGSVNEFDAHSSKTKAE
jgi:hypothetical protein